MVKHSVLLSKIEHINRHLSRLRPYSRLRLEHFLESPNAQDIVEYNLFQAINHLIAMMEHIVVDEEYGLPQSAADAAVILKSKKIFTAKDADLVKKMVGFRNVVGHDYIHLDKRIVHTVLIKGVKDLRRVIAKLARKFKSWKNTNLILNNIQV